MNGVDLAVAARGLGKRYGSVRALDGLTLAVPRGSVFGLVGPNGAGKTTFIKTVLGVARPDHGEVQVFGGDPHDVAVRARIGYLPENLQIPGHLDAFAFLASVARLRGLPSRRIRPATETALTRVGLAREAWTRRASGWSKGMRQRAGLAAALVGEPELLVLDEPTDGIDPLGRVAIRAVIAEVARQGTTVVLNSHLLAETEQICDRVAVLARGRIVLEGPLSTLRALDRTRIRFVDAPEVAAVAAACGLIADADDDSPGLRTFSLLSADPASLSATLARALASGLLVAEVGRPMRTLESILCSALDADGAPEAAP